MTTRILDGKALSQKLLAQLKTNIAHAKGQPGLAVVLVGENPASQAYVRMKKKACKEIGIVSIDHDLAADVSEQELVSLLGQLNGDPKVHGILLQLPLPKHLDEDKILSLIHPDKDVDGFHPMNVGRLMVGLNCFRSCTPYGVCVLMKEYGIDPEGRHVVIVGRSNIVGKPLAAMLMQNEKGANATVTVCHSKTKNLASVTRQADILIAAIGRPRMITADMVKEGAVVMDVGINRVEDPSAAKGYRLVGDVDYDGVAPKTSAITPVPGGVGPMTIAMLMTNTWESFRKH